MSKELFKVVICIQQSICNGISYRFYQGLVLLYFASHSLSINNKINILMSQIKISKTSKIEVLLVKYTYKCMIGDVSLFGISKYSPFE